jgi:hypothetical protein
VYLNKVEVSILSWQVGSGPRSLYKPEPGVKACLAWEMRYRLERLCPNAVIERRESFGSHINRIVRVNRCVEYKLAP